MSREIWLVRHGQTEWSLSGAHTGRTDIPLTEEGRKQAASLRTLLAAHRFALVLSSPLQRSLDTCRLSGFGESVQIDSNLLEWDYGQYEGRTTADIHKERPDWVLWRDGVPGGEAIEQVATRAGAVLRRAMQADGDTVLFAHGHVLRILTACWLELPPSDARLFALGTASVSVLGYERETCVISRWNLSASE
jgi:broad specificity phosphatase PhoE